MIVKKAVFPVAGIGSRMLPITKSVSKEMLLVLDKPVIQYAVEEALASGITDFIFVVGDMGNSIKKYFDVDYNIADSKKLPQLAELNSLIKKMKKITYIKQKKPLGLGDAILCTKNIICNEPFAVLLPDDLIRSEVPVIGQIIKNFQKLNSSIIAISAINKKDVSKYAILNSYKVDSYGEITRIFDLIEKPVFRETSFNLAVVGRYVFTPDIFKFFKKNNLGYKKEIQLTDAVNRLIKYKPVYGCYYNGVRFDCGSKVGLQMANLFFSLGKR